MILKFEHHDNNHIFLESVDQVSVNNLNSESKEVRLAVLKDSTFDYDFAPDEPNEKIEEYAENIWEVHITKEDGSSLRALVSGRPFYLLNDEGETIEAYRG